MLLPLVLLAEVWSNEFGIADIENGKEDILMKVNSSRPSFHKPSEIIGVDELEKEIEDHQNEQKQKLGIQ